jgi:hypothetical protein
MDDLGRQSGEPDGRQGGHRDERLDVPGEHRDGHPDERSVAPGERQDGQQSCDDEQPRRHAGRGRLWCRDGARLQVRPEANRPETPDHRAAAEQHFRVSKTHQQTLAQPR